MHIGLDIGTSGVKAVLLADDDTVVGNASAALAVSRPQPRWSEQNPDDWWRSASEAVAALPADLRRQVRGIGLAGQMHGAVLLDNADRPLRPAILWSDGRADAECAWMERHVPALRAITGNAAMPGFTAPKVLWVGAHEPQVFDRMLLIGSAGIAVALGTMALCFAGGEIVATGLRLPGASGLVALVAANLYIVFFNLSWGPVMWVMLGELFPNRLRGPALAVAGFAQWIANFAVSVSFPALAASAGLTATYGFYALSAVVSFVFVQRVVSETRGAELEAMPA